MSLVIAIAILIVIVVSAYRLGYITGRIAGGTRRNSAPLVFRNARGTSGFTAAKTRRKHASESA